MPYNYTKKIYTIPFTGYTGDAVHKQEKIRLVVLRGGTKPVYITDGYGSGTSHMLGEIFDYLRTWGVEPSDLSPSFGAGYQHLVASAYATCGQVGPYYQTRTAPLLPWVPSDPGSWDVGWYTLNKQPYLLNAMDETGYFFKIGGAIFDITKKQISEAHKGFVGMGGGALNYMHLFILWLPEGYENDNSVRGDSRSYVLYTTAPDAVTLYMGHETSGLAHSIYDALVAYGDIDDYEGTGSDPYIPGGTSEPGGGTGTFDMSSDTIGVPALPALSAVDTGLVSAFSPDATQAKALATYLWDMNVDWTAVKKVISDPINTIFGFSILPYTPDTGTAKVVKLGSMSTGVSMPPVTNQYKEIDCGTLNIQEFWGSYLDYSPYTKTSLYLPYIGIVPIDIDDIMGKTLQVVYHCDCISGACIAYILSNGSQIANYIGQVSSNVPISSRDFTNTLNGILGVAGSIGGMVMTGGASAPTAIPGLAANAINAMKPNIQKSGALSGTGGIMGTQIPFLIAQRPRQCLPANYNVYGGYPSYITETLGNLSGFTKVSEIHLSIPEATDEEREEIEAALKEGVII